MTGRRALSALVPRRVPSADERGQTAVLIPALMEKLDEANAPLGQTAGHQAVGGEGAGLARVFAIHVVNVFRFFAQVGCFGHA